MTRRIPFLLLVYPLTNAFRPPRIRDELGCSPTLSFFFGRDYVKDPFFFDPLRIANDSNFPRLRESELKAGRVAMLAVAETMLVPLFKQTTGWIPKDFPDGIMAGFKRVTTTDVAKVVILCGFLELVIFVQRDPKALPGDYGLGYFGVRDKSRNEISLVSELENGRLAMIAFVVQLAAEYVSGGESWEEQWLYAFKTWIDQQLSPPGLLG